MSCACVGCRLANSAETPRPLRTACSASLVTHFASSPPTDALPRRAKYAPSPHGVDDHVSLVSKPQPVPRASSADSSSSAQSRAPGASHVARAAAQLANSTQPARGRASLAPHT